MKKIIYTVIILFCIIAQNSIAQVAGKICNWDHDKNAAVVLTFDDWSPGQFPIATPELLKRNINATFFIVTNNVQTWDNVYWPKVQEEVTNGNEIGNHTYTHVYLNQLNTWPAGVEPAGFAGYSSLTAQISREIGGAKKTLEQYITTQPILSFAYPYGAYNTQVLDTVLSNGHICARGVTPPTNFTYNFAVNPMDYYNLNTYPMSSSVTLNAFYGQIQNVINGGGLLTYLYHSLDNGTEYGDNWYSQVQQSALELQMDTLVSVRNKVWITTLMQAIKYHKEKRCAALNQVQAFDGTKWIVNLTDTLSQNSIYNQPLSLKLKMNGIPYKGIMQNGNSISIDSVYSDTIMFRAIPDNGPITLSVNTTTGINPGDFSTNEITLSPVPTNGILNIHATKTMQSPSFTVYDATGRKVYDASTSGDINTYQIDLSGYTRGIYYVYISELNGTSVKKALVMD